MERTFARIFTVAYLKEYLQQIEVSGTDLSPWKGKWGYRLGVVAHDAHRGANAHWLITDGNKVLRYQIITPSDRNFSPDLGPVERSIIGQKVTEEAGVSGLDALRIVRSFDPCSACAVHLEYKNNIIKLIV